jgi:glycosyltransferase involved in cell wall biosynthesis
MNIGITAFAADGGMSGIGQYIKQTLARLPSVAGKEHSFVVFMSETDERSLCHAQDNLQVVPVSTHWNRPILNILWHLLLLPLYLRLYNCDLVLFPAGNRRLAYVGKIPSVGVIHDLSQLHVKGKYDRFRTAYVLKILPFFLRKLDTVVAVSHSTARDLADFAGLEKTSISVIHNGADVKAFSGLNAESARQKVNRAYSFNGPYILYTARLEHPGKNHVGLLQAFAKLKRDCMLQHKLILAGGRWNGAQVIDELIVELELGDAVLTPGYVDAALLPDLTGGADLFVFPSLYEGFGIPLLESMAAGTPLCASNVSSIPEVVGDAGVLFEPDNIEDMARSMQRILTDESVADTCRSRGLRRVKSFDWQISTHRLFECCLRTFAESGRNQVAVADNAAALHICETKL